MNDETENGNPFAEHRAPRERCALWDGIFIGFAIGVTAAVLTTVALLAPSVPVQ